ncbi:MAG: alpha/beta hydrolase [Alphaproteobacteria bacterium]
MFAAAGYRVIAPSRRGSYKSIPGPKEDPGTASGDVLKLVDSLGLKKFHLVGVAAGGVTATAFAVEHPDRLQSLLLSNTVLLPDEQEWRDMSNRLLLTALGSESTGVSTTWREIGPNYRAGNPEGTAEWTAHEAEARPNGLYNGQQWGAKVNWETMGKMTAPVLIATGDSDLWAPPVMQRLFAQHFPNNEVTVIKESGHAPYWEQPEAFNAMVLDWVGRHKATPAK